MSKYLDQNGLAMEGVITEVNLGKQFHAGDKAHKCRMNLKEMSPGVQNRSTCGPTKRTWQHIRKMYSKQSPTNQKGSGDISVFFIEEALEKK